MPYPGRTIKDLFEHFGNKPILIADWQEHNNFLAKKIASDGLAGSLLVTNEFTQGDTYVKIIPNKTSSKSDIDSALIVSSLSSKKSVLNVNDCIYNDKLYDEINAVKSKLGIEFTLFCLGYTGAGPYPQTYYSPLLEKNKLEELAENKKQMFFKRYLKAIAKIDSVKRLPFAGKYVLKGDLSILNRYRGVSDALEVMNIDKGAVILDDGGDAYFDLETISASATRLNAYPKIDYLPADTEYSWRTSIGFTPNQILLKRLLRKSITNAHSRSECSEDCYWTIYAYEKPSQLIDIWSQKKPWDHFAPLMTFNCNKTTDWNNTSNAPKVHNHMFIESKALFAVLTGVTHWNNYEVGSVYQVRRIPDQHIPQMQKFLNFMSVI